MLNRSIDTCRYLRWLAGAVVALAPFMVLAGEEEPPTVTRAMRWSANNGNIDMIYKIGRRGGGESRVFLEELLDRKKKDEQVAPKVIVAIELALARAGGQKYIALHAKRLRELPLKEAVKERRLLAGVRYIGPDEEIIGALIDMLSHDKGSWLRAGYVESKMEDGETRREYGIEHGIFNSRNQEVVTTLAAIVDDDDTPGPPEESHVRNPTDIAYFDGLANAWVEWWGQRDE